MSAAASRLAPPSARHRPRTSAPKSRVGSGYSNSVLMFLGVEIGGTKLQAGACDARGRLRQLVRVAVDRRRGRRGILEQFEQIIPPMLREYDVARIGVGF